MQSGAPAENRKPYLSKLGKRQKIPANEGSKYTLRDALVGSENPITTHTACGLDVMAELMELINPILQ